jgi:hypothetical protein
MIRIMKTPGDRLKRARIEAGYGSAAEAARAMGVPTPTYQGHENGSAGLPRAAERYAAFFKVSLDWLLTGKGGTRRPAKIPVICYVGAGAEIHPIDDHPRGQGIELVEPPQGVSECVAAIIKGDSMYPLRDGWLIFWAKDQDGIPNECLGQLCVVQVKNGPTLVKEVRRGAKSGTYRLESWNAPPREDVSLDWAAKVTDIRPR